MHCKYLTLSHTKPYLYGTTESTYSARVFRPVLLRQTANGKYYLCFSILLMLSLNKSCKNRKVLLTIHCKYEYFDSTVQRAEDRRQKFYFCRLPFAVNVKLNLSNISRFKKRQIPPFRTFTNVLQFGVKFWVVFGHFLRDIFLKDRLN